MHRILRSHSAAAEQASLLGRDTVMAQVDRILVTSFSGSRFLTV